jgi:hypothetical protein
MTWPANHSPGVSQLLARLVGANMNVTTDQVIPWLVGSGPNANLFRYRVDSILVTNASISLTTAVGGIYDTASKGGVAIVAAAQAYSGLTAAGLGIELTIAAAGRGLLTAAPILSLTTAQGAAATADVYVFGRFIPTLSS